MLKTYFFRTRVSMAFRPKNAALYHFHLFMGNEPSVLRVNLGNGTDFPTTNEKLIELVIFKHKYVRVSEETFEGIHTLFFCQNFHFLRHFLVEMGHNNVKSVVTTDFTVSFSSILLISFQYRRTALGTNEINYEK